MRSKIIKIVFVVIGLVTPFFILEIIFQNYELKDIWGASREIAGETLRDCLVKDELLHHKLLPTCTGQIATKDYTVSLETNSLGFRDEEIGEKSENEYRVLLVGDSFTEGWGVERIDRFDEVAGRILLGRDDKGDMDDGSFSNIKIINAGVRSHSPILHLEYLRQEGIKLDPDLVVLMFDMSDLHDDYYYGGWERHNDLREKLFPGKNIYINELPKDRSEGRMEGLMKSKLISTFYDEFMRRRLNSQKRLERHNLSTDVSLFAKATDWEGYEEAWNLNIANMLLIRDYLDSLDIKYAVAVVPRGINIASNEWDGGRDILGIEKNKIYEPKAYLYIDKKLQEAGVETINIHTSLMESDDFPLYHSSDGHWTVKGNEIVGNVLAEYLEERIRIENLREK